MQRRVLNRGFVRLDDVSGTDLTVVKAARVSFGKETTTPEKDKKLIKFLLNHGHETPFEHVSFRFHVKCPIFVARQWFRHRWSSFNEISGRYTIISEDYYVPSYYRTQKGKNYEYEDLPNEEANILYKKMENFNKWAFNFYNKLIRDHNLAKEQARIILPQSMFTEFYWTVNARALMNFLKLRVDSHAQWEIRQYAIAILDMFKDKLPWTSEAFLKKEFGKK